VGQDDSRHIPFAIAQGASNQTAEQEGNKKEICASKTLYPQSGHPCMSATFWFRALLFGGTSRRMSPKMPAMSTIVASPEK
jgi:hypothetical protein